MSKSVNVILSKEAPAPIGPYSQAVQYGDMLFCSGQIPLDAESGEIVGTTIEEQTEKVCKNVEAVLKAAGMDFSNVIKTMCFVDKMADFAAFNEVYGKYFVSKPARSCVAAKELPKSVLVEVEVIAVK